MPSKRPAKIPSNRNKRLNIQKDRYKSKGVKELILNITPLEHSSLKNMYFNILNTKSKKAPILANPNNLPEGVDGRNSVDTITIVDINEIKNRSVSANNKKDSRKSTNEVFKTKSGKIRTTTSEAPLVSNVSADLCQIKIAEVRSLTSNEVDPISIDKDKEQKVKSKSKVESKVTFSDKVVSENKTVKPIIRPVSIDKLSPRRTHDPVIVIDDKDSIPEVLGKRMTPHKFGLGRMGKIQLVKRNVNKSTTTKSVADDEPIIVDDDDISLSVKSASKDLVKTAKVAPVNSCKENVDKKKALFKKASIVVNKGKVEEESSKKGEITNGKQKFLLTKKTEPLAINNNKSTDVRMVAKIKPVFQKGLNSSVITDLTTKYDKRFFLSYVNLKMLNFNEYEKIGKVTYKIKDERKCKPEKRKMDNVEELLTPKRKKFNNPSTPPPVLSNTLPDSTSKIYCLCLDSTFDDNFTDPYEANRKDFPFESAAYKISKMKNGIKLPSHQWCCSLRCSNVTSRTATERVIGTFTIKDKKTTLYYDESDITRRVSTFSEIIKMQSFNFQRHKLVCQDGDASTVVDRNITIFKGGDYNINIDGVSVKLCAAPKKVKDIQDIEILLDILDYISLKHELVLCKL